MKYEIGKGHERKSKSPLVLIDTKSVFTGFRIFARNEATGLYHEILECSQEQLWVDGENQGAWSSGPHETREGAIKLASAAYRKMNRAAKAA